MYSISEMERMVLVLCQQIALPAVPSLSDHRWIDKGAPVAFWLLDLFFFCVFGVSSWEAR
jgi:hypothetical protein